MHTEPAITSPASPVPVLAPKPVGADTEAAGSPPAAATSRGAHGPVRSVLAKVMSVLHGDKYMVGAYPATVSPADGATATDAAPPSS